MHPLYHILHLTHARSTHHKLALAALGRLACSAGYRSASEIAAAEPEKLCADVLQFADTAPGERLIGEAATPDREKIKGWCAAARNLEA